MTFGLGGLGNSSCVQIEARFLRLRGMNLHGHEGCLEIEPRLIGGQELVEASSDVPER